MAGTPKTFTIIIATSSNVEAAMSRRLDKPPQPGLFGGLSYRRHLLVLHGAIDVSIPDLFLHRRRDIITSRLYRIFSFASTTLFAYMSAWEILVHDVYHDVFGDILSEPLHDFSTLILLSRHHQVSHHDALFGNAIKSEAEVTNLLVHGFDALHGSCRVVVRFEQPFACRVVPHLEVWQVYVDQPGKQLYTFQGIERGRVIDDGDAQTELACVQDGEDHLGNDVFGRDEVDVVHLACQLVSL